MTCPWCNYIQVKGSLKFSVIKTTTLAKEILRYRVCPECNKSFTTSEKPLKETFFKKEENGHTGIHKTAEQA